MSLENLLDHKCDIFHIVGETGASSYGLPGEETFEYPDTADIPNVDCHFSVKSVNEVVSQTDPKNIMMGSSMLTLPFGTDVRILDKIVDKSNDIEYTAGLPRNVRVHHIKVPIFRTNIQEAL